MKIIFKKEQRILTESLLLALWYVFKDDTISDKDKKADANSLLNEIKSINHFRSEKELQDFITAYISVIKSSKEESNGD